MSTIPPKTQPKKQRTAAPKKCNRDLTFNEATRLALSSALSSASEPPKINQEEPQPNNTNSGVVEIEGRSNEPFELGMAAPRPERSREMTRLSAASQDTRGHEQNAVSGVQCVAR